MTTYRIGDRVIVTHDTTSGGRTFTGTVTNAWPAGSELTYAVRPDGVGRRRPDTQANASQMGPLDEGGES